MRTYTLEYTHTQQVHGKITGILWSGMYEMQSSDSMIIIMTGCMVALLVQPIEYYYIIVYAYVCLGSLSLSLIPLSTASISSMKFVYT